MENLTTLYPNMPSVAINNVETMVLDMAMVPLGSRFSRRDQQGFSLREMKWGVPLITLSDPGSGKSATAFGLADKLRTVALEIQAARDGLALTGRIPGMQERDGKMLLSFPEADIFHDFLAGVKKCGQPGVVIFEDLSAALDGATEAALLGLLQKGAVGNIQLPGDTIMVGSMNPPRSAPDGRDLAGAMCGRVGFVIVEDPSAAAMDAYSLAEMFEDPAFGGSREGARFDIVAERERVLSRFMSADAYPRYRARLMAFLRTRSSLIRTPTKPNQANAEPRKWSMVAKLWGSLAARGVPSSVDGYDAWQDCTAALIGNGPALEALAYLANNDFPDVLRVLRGQESWEASEQRPDKTAAFFGELVGVLSDKQLPDRKDLAAAATKLLANQPDFVGDLLHYPVTMLSQYRLVSPKGLIPLMRKISKLQ